MSSSDQNTISNIQNEKALEVDNHEAISTCSDIHSFDRSGKHVMEVFNEEYTSRESNCQ